MRVIFVTFICLSSLPWHDSVSSVFEVHEFMFMNKSILYLWKRGASPMTERFCLCYGHSHAMTHHFMGYNCSRRRKGSWCHLDHTRPGLHRTTTGCLGKFQQYEFSLQQYPTTLNTPTTAPSAIECRAVDNTTTDVVGEFPGDTNFTFCSINLCKSCTGGFSNYTYCTNLWTRDPRLRFQAITDTDFSIGVKWNNTHARNQSLVALVCASEGNCHTSCFLETVPGAKGEYLVPTDLWRFKVALWVHRSDGVAIYQKNFRSKRLAPDKPCFWTSALKSWTEVRLYWWPHDESSHGYTVSWCEDFDLAEWFFAIGLVMPPNTNNSKCSINVKIPSATVRHLQPFKRYQFRVMAYRWTDSNHTERLFSRPLITDSIIMINPYQTRSAGTTCYTGSAPSYLSQTTSATSCYSKKAL
ncbi:uncharacterized protein LOC135395252 isoform X2 [Ornithodoros turicata]|uniref:uncharacterized protein LOC135395252 isoform X2 n=1 Tax=Ornithodoros turicata TaxID=34597 RepID=UPI003138E77F